ncbi:MAG: hypothetical protein F6K23_24565 [Okeania sp. SIO2C9]|uniref:hypothetical protein n=1 Tax=Okeania sp. SIO2C9 TaxID=2607791 RepID=UPI0013BF12BC|nr:hypothetical protein [Okeania sp. SIO2C9]NEQ75926.1 hypothetical protein [Okeania sp. SIO2C9]
MLVIFHASRNGWKNFENHKHIFIEASQNEKILPLLLGKILENPLTGLIFPELHKIKMLVIFHASRNGWKNFENNKHIFIGASQNENILALLLGKIPENPLTGLIFPELHKMKILVIFHASRNGWKNFENNKHIFIGASQNENILALLLGKIPENPLTGLIFPELHKMKILVIFHASRNGWKNFENNKHIFIGASQNENILTLLLGKIPENPLTGLIFPELHKIKMLVIFHASRNGWKNFENHKHIFIGASQNEKYSGIAPGEDS